MELAFGIICGLVALVCAGLAGTFASRLGESSGPFTVWSVIGIVLIFLSALVVAGLRGEPLTPDTGRYFVVSCAHTIEYDCLLYQKDEKVKFYRFPVKMRSKTLETVPRSGALLEVYEVSGRLHVRQIRAGRED